MIIVVPVVIPMINEIKVKIKGKLAPTAAKASLPK
jgi:hypothetical protein